MKIKDKVYRILSRGFTYNLFNINIKLNKKNRPFIVIFNYHQIYKKFDNRYHHSRKFTEINFFEKQIIWLNKNYKIIPLYQAIQLANQNIIEDHYVCITVDDGDKSILDTMIILEKYNIPATFFINSDYLDNQGANWNGIYHYIDNSKDHQHLLTNAVKDNITRLRNTQDDKFYNYHAKQIKALFVNIQDELDLFVSSDALKNINTTLFDVGLHGAEHERFSMMSVDWQRQNILKNIHSLSHLKSYKPIFAIPFGRPYDWTNETIKICIELGLEIVFTDGSINYSKSVGYNRIPADGRCLKQLLENNL